MEPGSYEDKDGVRYILHPDGEIRRIMPDGRDESLPQDKWEKGGRWLEWMLSEGTITPSIAEMGPGTQQLIEAADTSPSISDTPERMKQMEDALSPATEEGRVLRSQARRSGAQAQDLLDKDDPQEMADEWNRRAAERQRKAESYDRFTEEEEPTKRAARKTMEKLLKESKSAADKASQQADLKDRNAKSEIRKKMPHKES